MTDSVASREPVPAVSVLDNDPVPDRVLTRRSLLIGASAFGAAATARFFQPRAERAVGNEQLDNLIPKRVGPWTVISTAGLVDASGEETKQFDGYDQLVTRIYAAEGLPQIMFLVAYGSTQGGSLQLHRPDSCYPGQGFMLSQFRDDQPSFGSAGPIPTRTFTATRDDRVERVTYWTRIADRFPRNSMGEYAAILRSVMAGFVPDGILVRFSTIGLDIAASDRSIKRFADALVTSLPPAGARILLNATSAAGS